MALNKKKNLDPLYQLFEMHLLTRSYEDSAAFTKQLAAQYLTYLDSSPAHVPFHTRGSVSEDLESEVHEMLVKKMYGCVKSTDYLNFGQVVRVKKPYNIVAVEFFPPVMKEEPPTTKD